MAERNELGLRTVCEGWSRAVTEALRYQWRLLDAQYRAGMRLFETLTPVRAGPVPEVSPGRPPVGEERAGPAGPAPFPASPHELQELEKRALDCARRGVPIPRAAYDVRNRRRIDWSRFPEWARPVDPEVFTGSAHEG